MDLLAAWLLRVPLAPWPVLALPVDRDALLHGVVGGGGALLLAYAAWAHAHGRASVGQLRGMVAAGVGFLLSTWASMALRDSGPRGIAASLAGSLLVLWGARTLVRERLHDAQLRAELERRLRGKD